MARKALTSQELSEVEILRNQVAQLSKQLELMLNKQEPIIHSDDNEAGSDITISGDDYIKVISLSPMYLTLSTQARGRGKLFNFEKFGDVKRILYRDLVDIMENHRNFLEQGMFYILNSKVIRRHGLDDTYSKILTKEKIEDILKGNLSDAVNLFKTVLPRQQEFICLMLINDIVAGKEIDLNFVDRISRIVGYDLTDRANEIKEMQKILEESKDK